MSRKKKTGKEVSILGAVMNEKYASREDAKASKEFEEKLTTPALRATPPQEGNKPPQSGREVNSPPVEGWQAKPDGVVNSPPVEGWQAKPDGVVNSPPVEGWRAKPAGVVNSPPVEGWRVKPDGVVKRNTKGYMSLPYNPALRDRARQLRKAGMLHEVLLWQQLKKKQFHGLDFDRQKIIGNYIVDFYCASASLVIEIDGSSHNDKVEYDQQRDAYLESLGLHVVHIRAVDVLQNMVGVMQFLTTPALRATPPKEGNKPPQSGREVDSRKSDREVNSPHSDREVNSLNPTGD